MAGPPLAGCSLFSSRTNVRRSRNHTFTFLGRRDITTTARFYHEVETDVIKQAVMKMRGTGTEWCKQRDVYVTPPLLR